jgi:hypothetical protein
VPAFAQLAVLLHCKGKDRGPGGRKKDFPDAERLVKRLVAQGLTLSYEYRCLKDVHAMLKAHGDWIAADDRLHATAIPPHFSFADVYHVVYKETFLQESVLRVDDPIAVRVSF